MDAIDIMAALKLSALADGLPHQTEQNHAMHAEPPTARSKMESHSRRPGDRKRYCPKRGFIHSRIVV